MHTVLILDLLFILAANVGSAAFSALLIARREHVALSGVSLALKLTLFVTLAVVFFSGGGSGQLDVLIRCEQTMLIGYVAFLIDLTIVAREARRMFSLLPRSPYAMFLLGLIGVELLWTAQRLAFLWLVRP